ncbi:FAD/FMN-containing dehydrogenase [Streptomyces sp. yr375]|uniref:FAD-dependent oxidoreductase n=1 Tax=Streptomyces sp. yr375 TaxID=1761906 RepID=UPI0008D7B9C2|nr:FAD-binding oxidoreductase [Streptomyces sp. yr375]SES47526.1 FAD/FMN-containing dehydrogenase [Streptomyces sp. yr375]
MPDLRSAVNDLARSLSGYVVEPGSAEYAKVVAIDNGRTRTPPAYVVRANSELDVFLAIEFAQQTGLPMTVRGGGHSAAGYCLNRGGIVLDLGLMKGMRLDEEQRRLTVQMGATWADVYQFVADSGTPLIPIGGGCLTVGLPGFLQGGGYSFVSRSYGLGSDNVVEIKLVDATGLTRVLAADSLDPDDRDLFWACRGGGGGNFGVAVEMTLQLHQPAARTVLGGGLSFPLARAEEVIGAYDAWAKAAPRAMAAYGYVGHDVDPAEPTRKIPSFRITPVFNGEYAEGVEQLKDMLKLEPFDVRLYSMPLPTLEATIGRSTLVGDRLAYIRSGMIGDLGWKPEMIRSVQQMMASAPSPDSFVVWTHGRGRVNDEDLRGQGPYPHRDKRYVFELKAIWNDPAQTRANVEWAYDFGEALSSEFHGAYVNYIDPLQEGWATAYYGGNLEKLQRIKKIADPTGFFRFQQSVDSTFEPDVSRPLDLSPLNRTLV